MEILIISVQPIDSPEVTLIDSLIRLGCKVSVAGYGLRALPEEMQLSSSIEIIDFGIKPKNLSRLQKNLRVHKIIQDLLEEKKNTAELVWTINDTSLRECGNTLLSWKHVAQLYELFEYVPAIGWRRSMPFHSNRCIKIAQHAHRVVVPEYNRALIQQVWWDLPKTPTVLPNKPQLDHGPSVDAVKRAYEIFHLEKRNVILYQGSFAPERELAPFAKSLDYLEDDYTLYLMGKIGDSNQQEYINYICSLSNRVRYIGCEDSPNHLAYTVYGDIGLMSYVPRRNGNVPALNGLYCAPNKVWEYANAGIPMLSNNLPGLDAIFKEYDMGLTTALNPPEIADKIRELMRRHDIMGTNAKAYYGSVDVDEIIGSIIFS